MSFWELFRGGKRNAGLENVSREELRRATCEVEIKRSKAERNERLADDEMRTLIKEAVLAEGQAARKTFLRRAGVEKKKMRLFGQVADSLAKVQSALELLATTKDTSESLAAGLQVLPKGVSIEGVELSVAKLVSSIRGQTDIAEEVSQAVQAAWGPERPDPDAADIMREVEALEEAMIEGKGKDKKEEVDATVARIAEKL